MSSWEKTKTQSKYHFDNNIVDPKFDTVIHLGRIKANYSAIVNDVIEKSRPATWATRGYKGENNPIPSLDLEDEEYDLIKAGINPDIVISNLSWDINVTLQQISSLFALQDCMDRIHVQLPGQVWNLHIDKLQKWSINDPDKVMRIMIQLTDWQQGQFWNYGNHMHYGWKAGDVTTFDWQNVPHSTANASHYPRVTFQMTGIITDTTREFLELLKSNDSYVFE